MQYKDFSPTAFDHHLGVEDREEWIVVPCGQNRDSDSLSLSNFHIAVGMLGGESDTVEVHRFGHWGNGWFEIILVDPKSPQAIEAHSIEEALENYPVLDEQDYCEREHEEAHEVWANCYSTSERVEYVRTNRKQFDFATLAEMRECVKGQYFCGYASELVGS